jgi:hypothetical protein
MKPMPGLYDSAMPKAAKKQRKYSRAQHVTSIFLSYTAKTFTDAELLNNSRSYMNIV